MTEINIQQTDNGWYVTLTDTGFTGTAAPRQNHYVYISSQSLLAHLADMLGVTPDPLAKVELAPTPETDTVNPPAPGT